MRLPTHAAVGRGLRNLRANWQLVFVAVARSLLLTVLVVFAMLAPLDKTEGRPAQISYAHDGQRDQYLCAAINRQCLPSLAVYLDEGHRSVHGWYQRHTATSVDFSDKAASFRNLNRMA